MKVVEPRLEVLGEVRCKCFFRHRDGCFSLTIGKTLNTSRFGTSSLLPSASRPPPSPPKLPPVPLFPPSSSTIDSPVVDTDTNDNKSEYNEGLLRLLEDSTTKKKKADATEDDRSTDPGAVGPLEIGFAHPQHDETQNRQEIKRVACDAVEGDEGAELADDNVRGTQ